jgi:hypothetical protein
MVGDSYFPYCFAPYTVLLLDVQDISEKLETLTIASMGIESCQFDCKNILTRSSQVRSTWRRFVPRTRRLRCRPAPVNHSKHRDARIDKYIVYMYNKLLTRHSLGALFISVNSVVRGQCWYQFHYKWLDPNFDDMLRPCFVWQQKLGGIDDWYRKKIWVYNIHAIFVVIFFFPFIRNPYGFRLLFRLCYFTFRSSHVNSKRKKKPTIHRGWFDSSICSFLI